MMKSLLVISHHSEITSAVKGKVGYPAPLKVQTREVGHHLGTKLMGRGGVVKIWACAGMCVPFPPLSPAKKHHIHQLHHLLQLTNSFKLFSHYRVKRGRVGDSKYSNVADLWVTPPTIYLSHSCNIPGQFLISFHKSVSIICNLI